MDIIVPNMVRRLSFVRKEEGGLQKLGGLKCRKYVN